MAFLDQYVNFNPSNPYNAGRIANGIGEGGQPIAATWPVYEQQTPQYPVPQPYQLAVNGYRMNEIIYACIQRRLKAVSEPRLKLWNGQGKTRKEIDQVPFLKQVNPLQSMNRFIETTLLYRDVAGFSYWEYEYSNIGEILHAWPMRPDWCSFLRGQVQPIRAVRYQPYGLPFVDVPVERTFGVTEFDPIFPLIGKGLSKTAVALRIASVDNQATDYLKSFFQSGTLSNVLISVEQSLQPTEGDRMRDEYVRQHGGFNNWSRPIVLGNGAKISPLSMNFKDMAFVEIDGRNEARMCAVFGVPPILLSAKVGLEASTYSNYAEARKAFYEETIGAIWSELADEITRQMLPALGYNEDVYAEFDVTTVQALQEDRSEKWARAVGAWEKRLITRNDGLEEMGLDRLEGPEGEEYYEAVSVKGSEGDIAQPDQPTDEPVPAPPQLFTKQPAMDETIKALTEWRKKSIDMLKMGLAAWQAQHAEMDVDLQRRISGDLHDARTTADVRAVFERHWPTKAAQPTAREILDELRLAREALVNDGA